VTDLNAMFIVHLPGREIWSKIYHETHLLPSNIVEKISGVYTAHPAFQSADHTINTHIIAMFKPQSGI
jgi:hypothetical protein